MNLLTVKIPAELEQALALASAQRGLSKSDITRRALEQALQEELQAQGAAQAWVTRWRGRLKPLSDAELDVARQDHLQRKHLR